MTRYMLKESLAEVWDLSGGSPYFETPRRALLRVNELLARGPVHYSSPQGVLELRELVAGSVVLEGLHYQPDEIVVGAGGKPLIFAVLAADSVAGTEVVVPSPYYAGYPPLVQMAGARLRLVQTPKFRLLPEDLRRALNDKTSWLMLNSPANPTGVVYGANELRALGEVLRDFPHVKILSDEVYHSFAYSRNFASLAVEVPDLASRVVTLRGVSKTYGMTGWRVGFALGPRKLIQNAAAVQGRLLNCASVVSQHGAMGALEEDQATIFSRNAGLAQHVDAAVRVLSQNAYIRLVPPEGGFYLFPRVAYPPKLMNASVSEEQLEGDLVDYLRTEHRVTVGRGSNFGALGHLRLNISGPFDSIGPAMNAFSRGVSQFITKGVDKYV